MPTFFVRTTTAPHGTAITTRSTMSGHNMSEALATVEHLRARVQRILKCVINLHIEILVLESEVCTLLDEVRTFNVDLMEVQRLDALIRALNNYNGPTVCHEWPYKRNNSIVDEVADLAQILNANDGASDSSSTTTKNNNNNE